MMKNAVKKEIRADQFVGMHADHRQQRFQEFGEGRLADQPRPRGQG